MRYSGSPTSHPNKPTPGLPGTPDPRHRRNLKPSARKQRAMGTPTITRNRDGEPENHIFTMARCNVSRLIFTSLSVVYNFQGLIAHTVQILPPCHAINVVVKTLRTYAFAWD